jgi:hypothetical protein
VQQSGDEVKEVVPEVRLRKRWCRARTRKVVNPKLVVDAMLVVTEIRREDSHPKKVRALIFLRRHLEEPELWVHRALLDAHALRCGGIGRVEGRHDHCPRKMRVLIDPGPLVHVVIASDDSHPSRSNRCWRTFQHLLHEVVIDAIGRKQGLAHERRVPH